MKELIKNLRPDCFEDIIALVALFRPGPLQSGMVENFINRKHGREPLAYPDPQYQHEWLKPIPEPTYGIILYQEQVMQIAQVLAGYTLGGADLLRRAMGEETEEMAKQRSVFEEGAAAQGIDPLGHKNIRPRRKICGLWLQQIPLGRLRAGVLPDSVAENPLSSGIHGRSDEL